MKGRDNMKKKIFLLCLIVVTFIPIPMQGAEFYYPIGIGFSNQSVKREPDPPVNVPTETKYIALDTYPRRKRLPKTGEDQTHGVQFLGLLCLSLCFWGFLFTRLRKEEEHE